MGAAFSVSPSLRYVLQRLAFDVQLVRKLDSLRNEVWAITTSDGRDLVAKIGSLPIEWPYGKIIEVENEIRTTLALLSTMPGVVPGFVSSGRLNNGSWYIVRHAVHSTIGTKFGRSIEGLGDALVDLLEGIANSGMAGTSMNNDAFLPICDLSAEVSCLVRQLRDRATGGVEILLEIEKAAAELLDSLPTENERVVVIGNFTPSNIGVFRDGRCCLIDCSVFRCGTRLYDLTKLVTYLNLDAEENGLHNDNSIRAVVTKLGLVQASVAKGEELVRVLKLRHGLSWMARDGRRVNLNNARRILRMYED